MLGLAESLLADNAEHVATCLPDRGVNEPTKGAGLGTGMVAVLAVVCCAGLPLLVGAGLSVGLLVWVGGIAVGVVALAAALAFFALHAHRRRAAACKDPKEKLEEVA